MACPINFAQFRFGESEENSVAAPSAPRDGRLTEMERHTTARMGEVLEQVREGRHVLISGPAGTGKSVLLRRIHAHYRTLLGSDRVAAVAPTACAAKRIGGKTLHSWLGVGLAKQKDLDKFFAKGRRGVAWKRIRKTDVLIIDEISMVQPAFFQTVVRIVKHVAVNGTAMQTHPFGHISIIAFGDFCQLAPVSDTRSGPRFVFQTEEWKALQVYRVYLHRIWRQEDPVFTALLNRIRLGKLVRSDVLALRARIGADIGSDFTTLVATNAEAAAVNNQKYAELSEHTEYVYTARVTLRDKQGRRRPMHRPSLQKLLDAHKLQLKLRLRVGALVMCTMNGAHYALHNGSVARVTRLTPTSVILSLSDSGAEICMRPYELVEETALGDTLRLFQLPLILAWASTIHKLQGATLSLARMALGNCFEQGQLYSALGRVKSLEGLSLLSFSGRSMRFHLGAVQYEKHPVDVLLEADAEQTTRQCALRRVLDTSPIFDRNVFSIIRAFV
jgi:ATP-dependent DNA helicase PIF1